MAITKATYARAGLGGFYSGVGALVAGNSLKAGVRFLAYDKFKHALVDSDVSRRDGCDTGAHRAIETDRGWLRMGMSGPGLGRLGD